MREIALGTCEFEMCQWPSQVVKALCKQGREEELRVVQIAVRAALTTKPSLCVQKERQEPMVSYSMRYLLRLRPHSEQSLPLSEIPPFYSFLDQVMKKRTQRLIPKME